MVNDAPSPARRTDVTFEVDGVRCAAWLYPAPGPAGTPGPVVVMAHGFAGVRTLRLDSFAEQFQRAGYAVLLFDYRHFGASEGEPRQLLSLRRQRQDWRAAIAFARALPDVDPRRVVAWGTSLGGGHVLSLAAQDPTVAAVISQVPHVSGWAATVATGPLRSVRLGLAAARDLTRALTRRAPFVIPSIGAPGTLAVMTSPDAAPGLDRLVADSTITGPHRHDVAARISLAMVLYSPGRAARKVRCPVLVQVAERDAITPARATRRMASRLPHGELISYDCGHFDPYVAPQFAQVIANQVTFLRQHVPVELTEHR